eukprot:scaffold138948_cov31-Tisochrysis_lutea.AAC.3
MMRNSRGGASPSRRATPRPRLLAGRRASEEDGKRNIGYRQTSVADQASSTRRLDSEEDASGIATKAMSNLV